RRKRTRPFRALRARAERRALRALRFLRGKASEDTMRRLLKRGAPMPDATKFTLTLRVPDADIDRQGHVNNVAFVRYVQEAAVAHWLAIAPDEIRSAFTWVVRRHEVEYLRPAFPGEELILRTWVGEPSGATWERFTE